MYVELVMYYTGTPIIMDCLAGQRSSAKSKIVGLTMWADDGPHLGATIMLLSLQ